MLSTIIREIPSESAELEMLQRFERLLRKYARLLNYEDAYSDLVVFFLELLLSNNIKGLIGKPDAIIVNYITKAIKNEYIRLSKSMQRKYILYSDLNENEQFIVASRHAYHHPEPLSWIIDSKKLTNWEKYVLKMIFECGLTIQEIAELSGKSRQAINQTKLKALAKLRRDFDEG